jgi:hypothetical protein
LKFTLIQIAEFVSRWKALKLADEDLQALEKQIMDNPLAGAVIAGTGGVRKIRFAPPSWNRGKSGAARVCYALFADIGAVYLVTIFGKKENANLGAADKQAARRWMAGIKKLTRRID